MNVSIDFNLVVANESTDEELEIVSAHVDPVLGQVTVWVRRVEEDDE